MIRELARVSPGAQLPSLWCPLTQAVSSLETRRRSHPPGQSQVGALLHPYLGRDLSRPRGVPRWEQEFRFKTDLLCRRQAKGARWVLLTRLARLFWDVGVNTVTRTLFVKQDLPKDTSYCGRNQCSE